MKKGVNSLGPSYQRLTLRGGLSRLERELPGLVRGLPASRSHLAGKLLRLNCGLERTTHLLALRVGHEPEVAELHEAVGSK